MLWVTPVTTIFFGSLSPLLLILLAIIFFSIKNVTISILIKVYIYEGWCHDWWHQYLLYLFTFFYVWGNHLSGICVLFLAIITMLIVVYSVWLVFDIGIFGSGCIKVG